MTAVPPIFKDAEHQRLLDTQGYLVIDLLTADDIRQLTDLFYELHPEVPAGRFMSDSYGNDSAYKKMASERITRFFLPHFERLLTHYTPFGSSFLYKTPGSGSELAMHQDWTIVDETKHMALNIWVPLCDINESNGALHVLPGSHRHILPIRCPTLPFFFSGNEEMLNKYVVPMYVMAGQAVVLNQRLVHGSAANRSDKIRIAITSGVKTKDAQMYFHYKVPGADMLEVFKEDDDFLISFENFAEDIVKRPYLGEKIGDKPYVLPQPQGKELRELLDKMHITAGLTPPANEANHGLWGKIKQLINI